MIRFSYFAINFNLCKPLSRNNHWLFKGLVEKRIYFRQIHVSQFPFFLYPSPPTNQLLFFLIFFLTKIPIPPSLANV